MDLEWDDFEDFMERYGPRVTPEIAALRTSLWSEYDGIGLLVQARAQRLSEVQTRCYRDKRGEK